MPQPRCVIRPGAPYHLISRFVAGEWFIRTDHERRCYLDLFGEAVAGSDWRCFSFAIMSNHIHLGVVAGEDSLASWLREVHSTFATWINERNDRFGGVFVRGPTKHAVHADGVATLIAYIHRNPVRAGVVSHPAMSDWTSHRAYAGVAEPPRWLDVACGLERGGWSTGAEMDRWIGANDVQRKQLDQAQEVRAPRGRRRVPIPSVTERDE
jgi:hypothetical protein